MRTVYNLCLHLDTTNQTHVAIVTVTARRHAIVWVPIRSAQQVQLVTEDSLCNRVDPANGLQQSVDTVGIRQL